MIRPLNKVVLLSLYWCFEVISFDYYKQRYNLLNYQLLGGHLLFVNFSASSLLMRLS